MQLVALALVVALLEAACAAQLLPTQIYQATGADGGNIIFFAPGARLGGRLLAQTSSTSAQECSADCWGLPDCSWFNFEPTCQQAGGGCPASACQLLGSNCTLSPPVDASNSSGTAGFPIRVPPLELPGFATTAAAGMDKNDLAPCSGSVLPDACAFASALDAAAVCAALDDCRAVTVFSNGTDGCSASELAVLKGSSLSPSNQFVAPSLSSYLLSSDATVTTAADAAAHEPAAGSAAELNSTRWLGCIVALDALMAGEVVELIDGLGSAEECCRACRGWPDRACNVWTFCPQPGGCSYANRRTSVSLQQGDCQLLYQALVDPEFGWPPAVLSKGLGLGFTGGAPLAVTGPEVPGFKRIVGTGLFGQQGFYCSDSLKTGMQECLLSRPLPQLANTCEADPACVAFVYKPAGFFKSAPDTAYFRRADGADLSSSIRSPSSVLYYRQGALAAANDSSAAGDSSTAAPSEGGSSGLPAGAYAGIAVGACAAAAALAASAWAALRRRQRHSVAAASQSGAGGASKSAAELNSSDVSGASRPTGAGDSRPSTQSLDKTALAAQQATVSQMIGGLEVGTQAAALEGVSITGGQQPSGIPLPGCLSPLSLLRNSGASHAEWAACHPVPASPFAAAAARRSRQQLGQPPPYAAGGSPLGSPPDASPVSLVSPMESEAERTEEVQELLRHRARQEATELSAISAGTPSGTSGGGGGGGSHTTGSGSTPRLVPSALPPGLCEWVVPRAAIEYLCRPDGSLYLLGEGASGRVIKALFRGEEVAAKEIRLDRSLEVQEAFVAEAARLLELKHPHIITFFGVSLDEAASAGIIVAEYCAGRDLQSVLLLRAARTGRRVFGWWRSGRRVACEIAKALNYLHLRGIVHMDIKSSNVLLSASGAAKLADVGVSRLQTRTYMSGQPVVGTWAWIAPELLMGSNCSQAVDVYSFGVLLWEIMTGERPKRGMMRLPAVPDEAPQEAVTLMQECMALDPSTRPTARELLQRLVALQGGVKEAGGSQSGPSSPAGSP